MGVIYAKTKVQLNKSHQILQLICSKVKKWKIKVPSLVAVNSLTFFILCLFKTTFIVIFWEQDYHKSDFILLHLHTG